MRFLEFGSIVGMNSYESWNLVFEVMHLGWLIERSCWDVGRYSRRYKENLVGIV